MLVAKDDNVRFKKLYYIRVNNVFSYFGTYAGQRNGAKLRGGFLSPDLKSSITL